MFGFSKGFIMFWGGIVGVCLTVLIAIIVIINMSKRKKNSEKLLDKNQEQDDMNDLINEFPSGILNKLDKTDLMPGNSVKDCVNIFTAETELMNSKSKDTEIR